MKFANKVVVAINVNQNLEAILAPLRKLEFLKQAEIHLVHVFQTMTYAVGFSEYPMAYPVHQDRNVIEQSINSLLVKLAVNLFGDNFEGKIVTKCLFSDNPKKKFCEYLQDEGADLVVIASREKRGLFESSFATYVSRHSQANQIILKHKE
jgi:nucleotide-binding universal stress UspA family protein